MNEQEALLEYYKNELTYLRRMGREFSARFPKIASRLELSGEESADPHVERMIESFAFLTARLQRQMDREFPEITTALLSVLYPHLVDPVPPMAVAHFQPDPEQGALTTGFPIARQTPLFAQTSEGLICRFRTCYPVTLYPLEVVSAGIESAAQFDFLDRMSDVAGVLRLRVDSLGAPLEELGVESLRFHLAGESTLVNSLYQLLFTRVSRIAVLASDERSATYLPADTLQPVGFEPEDEVIPYPSHAHKAYRLLQEYFLIPQKFHFFDLKRLDLTGMRQRLDLLFLLTHTPKQRLAMDHRNFLLGCTPVVNLFRRTSEPIRRDETRHEYRLVADVRRERTTEIHSILSVSASTNPMEETSHLEPFFSFRHRVEGPRDRGLWYARRIPVERSDLSGTDMMLSFVDAEFRPDRPPEQMVFAHLLCTNRDFALQIPAGSELQIEETAPLLRITCLAKPTAPAYPPLGGATLWALVSNLSLNFLSLSSGRESLEALRAILRLYSFSDQPSVFQQVRGVTDMQCRHVMRRVGNEAWRGFCRGTEVRLTLDESLYTGSSPFLLGAVLERFFALYASVNSFTEMVLGSVQREGTWKRWPPRAGNQELV